MSEFKFTSDFIIKKLQDMYPVEDYAFFGELRVGTGYAGKDESGKRLDCWCIAFLKSKRNATTCFEIKVSKNDLYQHELMNPNKRRDGQRLSNHFYFVTPKGLAKIEDIPVDCGLMEIDESGDINITIPAPYMESVPTWQFVASIARRVNAHSIRDILTKKALEELMESYKQAALSTITNRIEFWKNYQGGDKRLPDRLAEELEYVLHQIIEEAEGKE